MPCFSKIRNAIGALCTVFLAVTLHAQAVAANNVTWTTLGVNSHDSMPIGNGDLAANVWTEPSGEIVVLLAKSDAWTETGKLVKLGRIRIETNPVLFTGSNFTQTLHLESGAIVLREGKNTARIWVDANHAALHVELHADRPMMARARLESWRTTHDLRGPSLDKDGMAELPSDEIPVHFAADTIIPGASALRWYHFNAESIYPTVLKQEHLESLAGKYPDPLLHRCFGALLTGTNLKQEGERALQTSSSTSDVRFDVVAFSQKQTSSEAWLKGLNAALPTENPATLDNAWKAHQDWWNAFWERSWIRVTGDENARQVTQGYAMQRYMVAASSRGELPTKFNGGLFTVGGSFATSHNSPGAATTVERSPDYRAWGNCYWNQNNRLLYWPLLASGDYDLLQPWFNMYLNALPLATDRVRLYDKHAGAAFPETMYFFGLPSMHDFGWNNPTNEIQSRWQRYHVQGALEVVAQMLDYASQSGDEEFTRTKLVPFADAIVSYYGLHWPQDAQGKIRMYPMQSLETYQLDILNPAPDIAGLMAVLPRLLALPEQDTTAAQRKLWSETLRDLPALPKGTTTAAGKTPPLGKGDAKGWPVLLPAEGYGKTSNSENPELYAAFPYHIYGPGRPELMLAQNSFAARRSPQNVCWGQDGTEAAALGMREEAQKAVVAAFTHYGDQRFQWFWHPGHDWIPDLDNGGTGMTTLQEMLLQSDGRKLILLPAWPTDWSAEFRLHAPLQTVIEGRVVDGKLVDLKVTPNSRKTDVVLGSDLY